MSEDITSVGEVDLSTFGIGRKKTNKKKVDLSKGEAMMFLLPPSKKGGSRNILFSPKAVEILKLDTESKESAVSFNFSSGEPFVCNLVNQDISKLPKNAALSVYHSHRDYEGSYAKQSKTWEKLGGQEDKIVSIEVAEFTFPLPSLILNTTSIEVVKNETSSTDAYDIEAKKTDSSVTVAVTEYVNN